MPRITLAVLAYRQQDFVEAAVRSALDQACEPIEIILSDDASPDATFARMSVLANTYRGDHRVIARRNASNLGLGAHINEVVRAASGELLVMMAADDLSTPDRVRRTAEAWDASGQRADVVASHVFDMSFDGRTLGAIRVDDLREWPNAHAWSERRPYVIGAGQAFTRRIFDRFGPLRPGVMQEDQVNTLRAILSGGAVTVDAPLVHYRRGGMSGAAVDASPEAFLARIRRRNALHLALHDQWLADARLANCEALVAAGFSTEHERESFIHEQLGAKDWPARWQAIRARPALPLSWRLRRATYLGLPQLALANQAARAGLARLRHSFARSA